MSKLSFNLVREAREEADETERRYLRSHGWKHTSSTPGCQEMWEKATEDGRVILTDTKTAVSMQAHSFGIRGNAW